VRRREEDEFEAEAEMFFEESMIWQEVWGQWQVGEDFCFFLGVCRVEGNWVNVLSAITRNRKGLLPENRDQANIIPWNLVLRRGAGITPKNLLSETDKGKNPRSYYERGILMS